MSSEGAAQKTQAGYRKTRVLLLLGIALIGFTRLEDRAIIGAPGGAPSAMAAMAIPPSAETDDGSYADDPDGVVPVSNATRVPRNRIRRALRDRDFNTVAARGAGPAVAAAPAAAIGGAPADAATVAAVTEAFAPAAGTPATFASLGPALGPTATPVFSASIPPPTDGGSTGGSTGGDPPAPPPPPGTDPVTAVPEPATWLSLILGFFGIGAVLRRRHRRPMRQLVTAR